MNLKMAARRLGVHYQTAYRWVRSGDLVAVKVGAGYEISDAALARFEARRAALERAPQEIVIDDPERSGRGDDGAGGRERAQAELAEMVERTTVEAAAVYQRAARIVARVLGDAAVVSLRDADGSSFVVAFDHPCPERAVVMGAVLRFGTFDRQRYVQQAQETRAAVLVPQVPQRDVRVDVRPEFHQYLAHASMYSAVCAPIVADDQVYGSIFVSRDTPGRPYGIADRDFVVAVAHLVAAAHVRADRGRTAWSLRERLTPDVAAWTARGAPGRARSWLAAQVGASEAAAIVNLDGSLDGCTEAFAELFGATPAELDGRDLSGLLRTSDSLEATRTRLHAGEFDYCSLVVSPATDSWSRIALHGTIVRRPDATPCCALYVAHPVPEIAHAEAATFSPR